MKTNSVLQKWIDTTPESDILQRYFSAYSGIKKESINYALGFMKKHFLNFSNKNIFSELICIDFSYPVKIVNIRPGTELVAFRDPRVSPFRGKYFTKSGHPADRLGIHTESTVGNNPTEKTKTLVRYTVRVYIPEVLESRCAAASDRWSIQDRNILAAGGALQYLIPHPERYVTYTTPFPK